MRLRFCSFQLAVLLLTTSMAFQATAGVKVAKEINTPIVLIGFAGPLSGTSAGVGKSMANAVQLAVDEANHRGLQIQGKPVLLQTLIQDDRANPRTAEFVARYLVRSHVAGVIGHWNSAASLAAAPIYNAAGVNQISPATMSTTFTQLGNRAVFRTIGNNGRAGSYTAEYAMKTLLAKRFVVVDDGTPFGRGFAEQFSRTAKESGAVILQAHSVSDKTSDFNAVLTDVSKLKPDAVLFGGLDVQAATLARNLKRRSPGTRFIGASGTVGLPFLRAAGADGNGSVVLEPGLPLEKMPGWKMFERNYLRKFGSNIDLYAPFAYDAAQVLIAAIRQANSLEPSKVTEALHTIRFNGLTGMMSFNQAGDLNNPAFTIYEVENQRWVVKKIISGGAN